jgi:transposase InsO family protein
LFDGGRTLFLWFNWFNWKRPQADPAKSGWWSSKLAFGYSVRHFSGVYLHRATFHGHEDRTLANRLTITALERPVARRQPRAGLVHHSDRGLQYARGEYMSVLEKYAMVPSMSRPANPYDNASCESLMKTLKREEIYANRYEDLKHLRSNVEEFIEEYYNRQRLHSALGYRSPEEFERQTKSSATDSRSATMKS